MGQHGSTAWRPHGPIWSNPWQLWSYVDVCVYALYFNAAKIITSFLITVKSNYTKPIQTLYPTKEFVNCCCFGKILSLFPVNIKPWARVMKREALDLERGRCATTSYQISCAKRLLAGRLYLAQTLQAAVDAGWSAWFWSISINHRNLRLEVQWEWFWFFFWWWRQIVIDIIIIFIQNYTFHAVLKQLSGCGQRVGHGDSSTAISTEIWKRHDMAWPDTQSICKRGCKHKPTHHTTQGRNSPEGEIVQKWTDEQRWGLMRTKYHINTHSFLQFRQSPIARSWSSTPNCLPFKLLFPMHGP